VSGFELVAGVIGIFFVAGIGMGVLIVTVLPMWRGRRYMRGGDRREPQSRDDAGPPRWPGG
jgi:hypothetical protein